MNFVRVALQSTKVHLASINRKQGGKLNLEIPVDEKLQEITVSISGPKPKIEAISSEGLNQNS